MIEVKPTQEEETYRLIINKEGDDSETYGVKIKKRDLYTFYMKLQEIFKEI